MSTPTDLITNSPERVRQVIDGCKYVSLDFESCGVHQITMQPIGVGLLTDLGCCYVPLVRHTREGGTAMNPIDPDAIQKLMSPVLATVPVIGHNAVFELHACTLLNWGIPVNVVDTMIGYWLLAEESQLGLKEVASAVTGIDLPDFNDHRRMALDWRKRIIDQMRETWVREEKALHGRKITDARREVANVYPYPNLKDITALDIPLEWLGVYCIKDCAYTAHLWFDLIRPCLASEDLLGYFYSYEMPFLKVLYEIERTGIALDMDRLAASVQELLGQVASLESEIFQCIGHTINLDSHQQKADCFFGELGYRPSSIRTDSGAPALNEAAIKELNDTYSDQTPLFALLLERQNAVKLREFALRLPSHAVNGRIYTNLKQTGTATGRLASVDDNLQQIPKLGTMRRAFIAGPGMKMVKADLSQAELRILADRSGDIAFLKVFRQAGDPHQQVVDALHLTGPDARRSAKIINFGIAYGMSAYAYRKRLWQDHRIAKSKEECEREFAGYEGLHSGVEDYRRRVHQAAREEGYVLSRLGRRRRLPDANSDDGGERGYADRQSFNYVIQGDVADWVKCAMIRIQPRLKPLGWTLCLQVHDELVAVGPEGHALAAARIIREELTDVFHDMLLPMDCEVGIADNWGDADKEEAKVK